VAVHPVTSVAGTSIASINDTDGTTVLRHHRDERRFPHITGIDQSSPTTLAATADWLEHR